MSSHADRPLIDSSDQGAWQPLLVGDGAHDAFGTLARITRHVATADDGPSLGAGSAGVSLYFAYLSRHTGHDAWRQAAAAIAHRVVAAAASVPDPSLYGGVTGAAWLVHHLDGWILDTARPDRVDPVDVALSSLLGTSPWTTDVDLVSGLVGLGTYALGRLPRPEALRCLELVVDRLAETARETGDGLTWLTPPERLPDWQRREAPNGYYNIGLAHGVPGIVSLLGHVWAAGVAPATSCRLLDGAVAWMLAQEVEPDGGPLFPAWVAPGAPTRRGPLHWCYGDPGLAAALLAAGHATGRSDWQDKAADIALRSSRLNADGSGVADAGICHGSAGLAHIYNRFWQSTGDPAFAAVARSWVARTPDLLARTPAAGFLEGSAGIGLVLLSALGLAPDWDVILGLSSPRGPRQ